jgi:DNA-binding NarL/FixJ family response regulator
MIPNEQNSVSNAGDRGDERASSGFGSGSATSAAAKTTRTVAICCTQPVAAEGLRILLENSCDLHHLQTLDSLPWALEVVRRHPADLLVVDKGFGMGPICEWLCKVRHTAVQTNVVIWGTSFAQAEAIHFLQAGARGILRMTASVTDVLTCLLEVSDGRNWMEDSLLRRSIGPIPSQRLTAREQQVVELVEQGLSNKEIGRHMGITHGTVKIHLNHIFTKTGARGRFDLFLGGLKDREPVA